mmetsp:Transcript_13603/g.21283  ORF Transcript_13603/g.21283 Transcript_13603/m.21283 type:complete len:219 (-) Transcript_13603:492-1148(-)
MPNGFWYVFGSLFNKFTWAQPHEGYWDLKEILETACPSQPGNWFIYHNGIDQQYQRAEIDSNKLCQARGSVFHFKCTECGHLEDLSKMNPTDEGYPFFKIDYVDNSSSTAGKCVKCGSEARPNVQLKDDMTFDDSILNVEEERLNRFMARNKRKPMTILEIGCSPVSGTTRRLARDKLLNDKYKVTLISINPLKERDACYQWEEEQFEKITYQQGERF